METTMRTEKPRGTFYRNEIDYNGTRARNGCQLRYMVQGRGTFPEDMLRYDTATAREEITGSAVGGYKPQRLYSIVGQGCTPARWASFGWSVLSTVDEELTPATKPV
jgi:hypothetical protein